jgi:hypothetical protein
VAVRPNEVWSWDIAKLKGPGRRIWYLLQVILDIYSTKVIHWEIWPPRPAPWQRLARMRDDRTMTRVSSAKTPHRSTSPTRPFSSAQT